MEEHLAPLAGKAERFPFSLALVDRLHRVIAYLPLDRRHRFGHGSLPYDELRRDYLNPAAGTSRPLALI
jgi:hypothetical protein